MEPPVVTVVIPGRGAAPGEVLAVGPALPRPPVPPSRWVGLAAGAVLSVGVAAVATYEPPPAPPAVAVPPMSRVMATAMEAGLRDGPFVARFGLFLRVAPPHAPGDAARARSAGGSPPVAEQVTLVAVTGRGLSVELAGAPLPVDVGPPAQPGAAMEFEVSVQVSSCEVDRRGQRLMALQVRQGSRTGEVQVTVDGGVVRLLDRLVLRTCRRSFG